MTTTERFPYPLPIRAERAEVESARSRSLPHTGEVLEDGRYRARSPAGMVRYAIGMGGIVLGCLVTWAGAGVGMVKIIETIREHLR